MRDAAGKYVTLSDWLHIYLWTVPVFIQSIKMGPSHYHCSAYCTEKSGNQYFYADVSIHCTLYRGKSAETYSNCFVLGCFFKGGGIDSHPWFSLDTSVNILSNEVVAFLVNTSKNSFHPCIFCQGFCFCWCQAYFDRSMNKGAW